MTLTIISGKFKGTKLSAPKNIRPATGFMRDALFNICQNYIENAYFLDIFAGSGAMGIEALSRGAKFSTFIDNDFSSIQFIKKNIKKLHLETSSEIIYLDAIKALSKLNHSYDIISIDPPFIFYKNKPESINNLLNAISNLNVITKTTIIFLEEPTYSKREQKGINLLLKKRRKYSSAYLLEYCLPLK